jgi:Rv2632c-like
VSRQKKNKDRKGIFTPAQTVPVPYPVAQQPYPVPFQAPHRAAAPRAFTIRVSVMPDPHATVATAELYSSDNEYTPLMKVTGSSKRDRVDDYDEETGTALAVSRAVIKLGRQLGRQADGAIRHAESVRKDKAIAREKRVLAGIMGETGKGKNKEGNTAEPAPLTAEELLRLFPWAAISTFRGRPVGGAADLPRGGAIGTYLAKHAKAETEGSE